jgi:large repetitive protein
MRLSLENWTTTLARMGYRVVRKLGPKGLDDQQLNSLNALEELETRQMLAATINDLHLINDTGSSSTDKITSDSSVAGTVVTSGGGGTTGGGGGGVGQIKVEFDSFGDGSVNGFVTLASTGGAFTFNPATNNTAVQNHTGAFALKYRTVELSSTGVVLVTNAWQTFNLTIQPDAQPEIQVTDASLVNIGDGGSYSFGTTNAGTAITKVLTVRNLGTSVLTLDAASLTLPAGFSLVNSFASTSIAAGQATTFSVRLDATTNGYKSGTLTFNTNDADENPFNFLITGTVALNAPDIEIRDSLGQVLPTNGAVYDFGSTYVSSSKTLTFTIANTGDQNLTLTNSSIVVPAGFSLVASPAPNVTAGASTTFQIRLNGTVAGEKSGEFRISSNDPNESPYVLNFFGNVAASVNDITLDYVKLFFDTGTSLSDKVSFDPRIRAQVNGNFQGGSVIVEFDHNDDGVAEGIKAPASTGAWITYDPRVFDSTFTQQLGERTVKFRTLRRDAQGTVVATSAWRQFTFTLTEDPSIGDMTIDQFGLLMDNGTSNTDKITTSPILNGIVRGSIGSGHARVEFDHNSNGTSDGFVIVDQAGFLFTYDPREFDSSFPTSGAQNFKYRLKKVDENGALIATGDWVSFNFNLINPPAGAFGFGSLGLTTDDGVSSTDGITSVGLFSGEVANYSAAFNFTVQYDLDGNGTVDGAVQVDEMGRFSFDGSGSAAYGARNVKSRIIYWDDDYDATLKGAWTQVTYNLQAKAAAGLTSVGLKNVAVNFHMGMREAV